MTFLPLILMVIQNKNEFFVCLQLISANYDQIAKIKFWSKTRPLNDMVNSVKLLKSEAFTVSCKIFMILIFLLFNGSKISII